MRVLGCTLLVVLALALPAFAAASGAPSPKLDVRLLPALSAPEAPVSVWIEFVDKGERGPGDLAARLAIAARDLSAPSRARRLRTGVNPLVDERDLPIAPEYLAALRAEGVEPYGRSRWLNGCTARVPGGALARLAALGCVRALAPAPQARARRNEPAPVAAAPWRAAQAARAGATQHTWDYGQTLAQMNRLNIPAVHDSGYTGAGVLVAMLDDGFNFYDKHSATRNLDVGDRTWDFVRGGAGVQDTTTISPTLGAVYFDHGEWTLSTLAGFAPGSYLGPGFGARFALAHTEDDLSEKPIEMVNWLQAAEWADSLGADIISSSLGYGDFPDSANGAYSITYPMLDGHTTIVTRAAEIAASKGILCIVSAGNDGYNGAGTIGAPADANGDSVMAIGSVTATGARSGFSSQGPTYDGRIKPDVMAQGSAVLCASATGDPNAYVTLSGTSFSCPLTAGVAACLIQAHPMWPPKWIIRSLRETASQFAAPDNLYGYGIINALAALQWTPDTAGVPDGAPRSQHRIALACANPVRGRDGHATFRFSLSAGATPGAGSLRVYDVRGRLVRTVWTGDLLYRALEAQWDLRDADGRAATPGVYLVAFEASGQRATARLVLLR